MPPASRRAGADLPKKVLSAEEKRQSGSCPVPASMHDHKRTRGQAPPIPGALSRVDIPAQERPEYGILRACGTRRRAVIEPFPGDKRVTPAAQPWCERLHIRKAGFSPTASSLSARRAAATPASTPWRLRRDMDGFDHGTPGNRCSGGCCAPARRRTSTPAGMAPAMQKREKAMSPAEPVATAHASDASGTAEHQHLKCRPEHTRDSPVAELPRCERRR